MLSATSGVTTTARARLAADSPQRREPARPTPLTSVELNAAIRGRESRLLRRTRALAEAATQNRSGVSIHILHGQDC